MLNSNCGLLSKKTAKSNVLHWFYSILAAFLLCLSPVSITVTQAQGFDATQLLSQLENNQISFNDAVLEFSQASGLPTGSAQNLLQSVVNTEELTQALSGDLLQNFVNGAFDIGDLQDITDMVNNFGSIITDPEVIQNMAQEAIEGALSPELAGALSTIGNIGDLINAGSIADVFANPLVTDALENLNIEGLDPEQILGQIETVAGLISDPAAFIQENLQQVTEQILDTLQSVAPELFDDLAEAFGGEEALEEALSGTLSTLTGGGTGGSGTSLSDGDPEMCTPECSSCQNCPPNIHNNHVFIRAHTSEEFFNHRAWFVSSFFIENVAKALMGMTNELVTSAMQQVQIIGTFFDAKHQLETQQLHQLLTAKAHKDYHPSEELCVVGTNMASIDSSKRKADLAQITIANRMMDRQLNRRAGVSNDGTLSDTRSRIDHFIEKFCNKTDGGTDGSGEFGLGLLCKDSNPIAEQVNADVNYTTSVENKLTLDLEFVNQGSGASPDEENIFALGANLFAHEPLPVMNETELQENPDLLNVYLDLRSMAAKRSVAQNSFAAITGMRAAGDGVSAPFLKALLKESGINDDEITELVGENPSYFAQEEIMTKALYQNPKFYANLYDKPANVERMGTALLAMEIIQDRNIYESLLRSEAVLATLVETLLLKEQRRVSGDLDGLKITGRKRGD